MSTKIDFSEIIANHISEQVENGSLKDSITKRIDEVIKDAIESATGYKFKRILSEQIEKQVCEIASELNFNEMLSMIFETQKQVIADQAKQAILDKANKEIKAFFEVKPEGPVNISEIIENFKEHVVRYNSNPDKDCIEADIRKTLWGSVEMNLRYNDIENISIYLRESKGEYTVSSVTLDGKDLSKTYTLSYVCDFKAYLIKLYLNKTPINIDVTEYDIDTELYIDED